MLCYGGLRLPIPILPQFREFAVTKNETQIRYSFYALLYSLNAGQSVTHSVFADLLEARASVDVFNAVKQPAATVTPTRLLRAPAT